MKKFIIGTALAIFVSSCGLGEKKEHQLPNLKLSVTIPGETKIEERPVSKGCNYNIGKTRISVEEIDAEKVPTDLAMLEEALKADEKFKSIIDKKTLPNGAFGAVYEKNGKSDVIKDFVFYFKKDSLYYQITPVFNSKGTYFDEAIESIGTLK